MGWFSRSKRDPQAEFAGRVLDRVRNAGVTDAWVDENEFAIRYRRAPGDEPAWIYLDNTYRECQGENAGFMQQQIDRLVDAVVNTPAMPETWAEVRDKLRPVIRTVSFGAMAEERMPLLSRPAFPHLNELVVVDTPSSMAYVTESRLGDWGVSREQVFHTARENLAGSKAAQSPERAEGPQILRIMDDGNLYAVSMLLLDGWLAKFADASGGPIAAFIPDNNNIYIVPESALTGWLDVMEKDFMEAPRSISPQAYTLDGSGAVIPYPIREGHPAARQLHRAATILAGGEYSAQKQLLERRLAEDVYVAECTTFEREDKSLFSVAVWPDGGNTLLPQADFIGFPSTDIFYLTWETLNQHVPLAAEPGMNPPRFRVGSWPSNVEALRALAVAP